MYLGTLTSLAQGLSYLSTDSLTHSLTLAPTPWPLTGSLTHFTIAWTSVPLFLPFIEVFVLGFVKWVTYVMHGLVHLFLMDV